MARKKQNLYFVTSRHAVLFFIFAIGGSVLLYFTKSFSLPGEIIVACSFGVMLTYAFFILIVPATRLRLDVAADNMYYLGFLYTLSSLAVAIYLEEPSKVLANFGVAITCTIIGIAFRVALNQLRVDPYDVEAASRVELSSATRRVSKELDQSIKELTKFRTMSMQVMAEGYEEVQKNVDGAGKDMFASLKETSDKNSEILMGMAEQSNTALKGFSDAIQSFKNSNDEIVSANMQMLNQISKTSEALEDLAEKYSNTNSIENKVIEEVKTGMNELRSKISDESSKSTMEVRNGMKELQTEVLHENRKSSKVLDEVLEKHSAQTEKVLKNLTKKTAKKEKEERSERRSRFLPRLLRRRS
jgi:methyl-accepting chemotaxis protein